MCVRRATGMLAAGVMERGAEAIGLDFSLEVVELASKLVPTGRFERGDAQALRTRRKVSMPCSADTASCTYQIFTARNAARVAPWWSNSAQRLGSNWLWFCLGL